MLKDRRSSQKPKSYPRQSHLPTGEQVREIYQTSVKTPNAIIELPFGESYVLSACRKEGTVEWTLYRSEDGNTIVPEWQYNSTDSRWICTQIMSSFPSWNPVRQYSKSNSASASDGAWPSSPNQDDENKYAIMEGDLANVALPRLFHSINKDKLTGRLEVHGGGRVIRVYVNDGIPVNCVLGKREGVEAFTALAAFTSGTFFFYTGAPSDRKKLPKDFNMLLQSTFGGSKSNENRPSPNQLGTFPAMDATTLSGSDVPQIKHPLYGDEKPALFGQDTQTGSSSSPESIEDDDGYDDFSEDPEEAAIPSSGATTASNQGMNSTPVPVAGPSASPLPPPPPPPPPNNIEMPPAPPPRSPEMAPSPPHNIEMPPPPPPRNPEMAPVSPL